MFRTLPILAVFVVACVGGCHAESSESAAPAGAGASRGAAACPMTQSGAQSAQGVAADANGV